MANPGGKTLSVHDYDAPAWGPLPVRPAALRRLLLLPLPLVFLPLCWVVWVFLAVCFYCVATVAELIVYMVPRAENGAIRVLDTTLGRVPFVQLRCVTPVALVREGDTAYYQAHSTDPGYLAYEQSLRDSGFLTDPDSSGSNVTAVDVHGGRKH
ncbi:hypothetical protein ACFT7S_32890 [Streptomyces sp. NPDC057136]|uniref:hypothetical protein n=1 Tax=Streptomyces sp. NPDC057136 TaxID=3346029 RepID=UPI003627B8F6